MSTNVGSVKLDDHLMADGTVVELWQIYAQHRHRCEFADMGELNRWLSTAIDSPLRLAQDLNITIHWTGNGPTPEQTQKILKAMAGLIQAISEVGYEMAQERHEGGDG
jgi:hypothetical protein